MALSASALKNKIKMMKEQQNKTTSNGEWPNCVFVPEGTHKGRFIVDPDGEISDSYYTYGYFAKGIRDPQGLSAEELPEGFDVENHPLKQLSEILAGDYNKFARRPRCVYLIYFYLMETDNKSDNWQPGNLYCLIANKKFYSAFNSLMTGLEDSIEELVQIMDPGSKSNGWIVVSVNGSGASGTINMSYMPHRCDPIVERTPTMTDEEFNKEMGKLGYRTLEQSYIRPGWNQEKYDNLVAQYTAELEKLSGKSSDESEESAEDSDTEESTEETTAVESTSNSEEAEVESNEEQASEKPVVVNTNDPFARFRRK